MRFTAFLAGVFVSALIFIAGTTSSNALSLEQLLPNNQEKQQVASIVNEVVVSNTEQKAPEIAPESIQPITHTVSKGESLSSIAAKHSTTWKRLFDKNTEIADPNVINVNTVIVIPAADEVLSERSLPTAAPPEPQPTAAQSAVAQPRQQNKPKTSDRPDARNNSGNNGYVAGYCTWYAKSRRPDLPNNLGNANTWVARARAQGIPTGSKPQVGAIGQQGMHVVYVESVNTDGTVTISEMNFKGRGIVSGRTVAASNFLYIY